MRKTAIKKNRKRDAFLAARNTPNAIKHVYTKEGKLIALNTSKHALLMKEYRNLEHSEEMVRDFINTVKKLENKKNVEENIGEPIILKPTEVV